MIGVEGAGAMREINFLAAWVAIVIGLLTGAAMGLFFHDADWMGGYGSWRRRMMRLGHISFFGTGFLNLAFVLSVEHLGWDEAARLVNQGLEATFAESEEIARRGPGGKLHVTYDIARQFPGYGAEAGVWLLLEEG